MSFHERQQFRQKWLWVLLLAVAIPPLLIIVRAPRAASVVAFVILAGVLVLMWNARLDVFVGNGEILIRFRPFHIHGRRIPLAEVAEARARKYSPIMEYGGWGIRMGMNGMAYNVSGDEGVQLVLTDGKRILVGSQRSAELEAAITSSRPPLR